MLISMQRVLFIKFFFCVRMDLNLDAYARITSGGKAKQQIN